MRKPVRLSVNARICLIHRYWCGAARVELGMAFGLGTLRSRLQSAIHDQSRAMDVWIAIHPGPWDVTQLDLRRTNRTATAHPLLTYGEIGGFIADWHEDYRSFINRRSVK